uniref:folate gamma-glutamyl hydrolase n=1 Tax=Triatoma infestans TaxID=30076 RepID=A0A171A467_TRIIF
MAGFIAITSSSLICFLTLLHYGQCTTRPMIGILAQEFSSHKNGSFITASYVKAIEASGARVVPIFIGKSKGYYIRILSELNGVIFPGGTVNFHASGGYAEAGQYIFEEAIYLNNHGRHFPILGVCQGLQLLVFITNNKTDLLTKCSGTYNTALNLNFTKGSENSSLYGNASRSDLAALAKFNLTVNQHQWCLTEKNLSHFRLDKFWKVLTLNNDAKDMSFISSLESYRYPFVGVQFHPEKVAYEWNPSQKTPHSPLAVRVNRLFYDWLIYQARFNRNAFNSTSLEDRFVIYNFSPTFTGRKGGFSEQVYYFRW